MASIKKTVLCGGGCRSPSSTISIFCTFSLTVFSTPIELATKKKGAA
jgi:hypothetical protein